MTEKTAIVVEILGSVVVGIGVGIEIGYGADLGFMLISGGSLLVAVGALIWTKALRL